MPVAGVGESRDRAAGTRQDVRRLVEAHVTAEQIGLHRMPRLGVGERPGQGEPTRLGARVAAACEIEIDEMRPPEACVALDDEDGMAPDDDRQGDSGQPRDGRRPEPSRVDDDRGVNALARGGLHTGDAVTCRADRDDLDALLDTDAAPPRRVGVTGRDRGRVAVARLGLVEDGAEILGIDPSLYLDDLAGLEHLGADAERPLEPDCFLELRTHRGGDADADPTAAVARPDAADGLAEALEDGERAHDHLAGLRCRVKLADDPDGPAGAAGGEGPALDQEDVPPARAGPVEGDGDADDAATDDDDLGVADHLDAAAVTSAASASSSKRTGSP